MEHKKVLLLEKPEFHPLNDHNGEHIADDASSDDSTCQYCIVHIAAINDDGAEDHHHRTNDTQLNNNDYGAATVLASVDEIRPPNDQLLNEINNNNSMKNRTQQVPIRPKSRKFINIAPKQAVVMKPNDTPTVIAHANIAVPIKTNKPNKPAKKRDDSRRVTHNEVERRRRDKINHWIEKLGSIIPVDGQPSGALLANRPTMFSQHGTIGTGNTTDGSAQSKGGILSKACEYVTALHHKVHTLNECLKESDKVNAESQRLRESNARLAIENDLLRERLAKLSVSPTTSSIVRTTALQPATYVQC